MAWFNNSKPIVPITHSAALTIAQEASIITGIDAEGVRLFNQLVKLQKLADLSKQYQELTGQQVLIINSETLGYTCHIDEKMIAIASSGEMTLTDLSISF